MSHCTDEVQQQKVVKCWVQALGDRSEIAEVMGVEEGMEVVMK